jgi:D-glycero-beta-D-manno-heptose 1-phosphate adenylyltransferase
MLLENAKLAPLDSLREIRQRLRSSGRRVVLTNGCFDLLHTGHIYFLQRARQLGDCLLVALNSDASVRLLKGPKRPVQTEAERAFALAALDCVDHVVIFQEANLMAEIDALQPDVYTKAGDYDLGRLHPGERGRLESVGTEIHFLPYLDGFSTTNLIRRVIEAGGVA